MARIHCLSERPNDADSRWRRQSCFSPWGTRSWFSGTCGLTSRLVVLLLCLLIAGTAGARHPLEPVDTSSPRATLESFLSVMEETGRRYHEYRDSPSPTTMDAVYQMRDKFSRFFDLSQVPPAARGEFSVETFMLLWEVIARLELPDLEEIPDTSLDKAGVEAGEQPQFWRIPHTEITIAWIEEETHRGEWLFSADTVSRARSFYEKTKELPYQRPVPVENVARFTQRMTGWMIPIAWVEALPDWANNPVLGQILWKWFAVLLLFGLAFAAVIAVYRWGRRRPWDGSPGSYLRYVSTPLTVLILAPLVDHFIIFQINVSGSAAGLPFYLIEVANSLAIIWLIWLTASLIAEAIIASPRVSFESLDAHMLRFAARSVGILAILVLMFRLAHDLGIPVYGLVAGAGVGGLAVALAARSTLENFMGTLNLYADRPTGSGR